ncbi:MAG: hypothetical protein L0Z73_09315 [Gammaproteobacteria bacterium]|nr:hypothetical protein [Gammaproteobacteria bacterium]
MRSLVHLSIAIFLVACGMDQSDLKSGANQNPQNTSIIEQTPVEPSPDLSASDSVINQHDISAADHAIDVEGISVEGTDEQPASSEQIDTNAEQASGTNQEINKLEIVKQPNEKPDSKS